MSQMRDFKMREVHVNIATEGVPKANWPQVITTIQKITEVSSVDHGYSGLLVIKINTKNMADDKAFKVFTDTADSIARIVAHKVEALGKKKSAASSS